MDISAMVCKIKSYNEISEFVGHSKVAISFEEPSSRPFVFTDYKIFKKFVNETYIPKVAKKILSASFEFGKETDLAVITDTWVHVLTVRFNVVETAYDFRYLCARNALNSIYGVCANQSCKG